MPVKKSVRKPPLRSKRSLPKNPPLKRPPAKRSGRPVPSQRSSGQRAARLEAAINIYTLDVSIFEGPMTRKFVKKNPVISRTIGIRGDQSLQALHTVIFEAFDRFDEHMYEFQVGGKGPQDPKARRYGLVLDEAFGFEDLHLDGDVGFTTMDALKLKTGDIFGYWFDYGDNWWHQVDVTAIEKKSVKGSYPTVTRRIGESPPQYIDPDE